METLPNHETRIAATTETILVSSSTSLVSPGKPLGQLQHHRSHHREVEVTSQYKRKELLETTSSF